MACYVLLAGAVLPIGVALPASAAVSAAVPATWGITRLSVHVDVEADGVLQVTETIDYDYSSSGFPLVRVVRLRQPSTGHPDVPASRRGIDRVWEVFDVSASSLTGANADLELNEWDPWLPPVVWSGTDGWDSRRLELHIKVGKPLPYISLPAKADKFPSRPETFLLRYRVRGAMDRVSDGYELNWPVNLRGNESEVTGEIKARLTAPGQLISASCAADHYDDAWLPGPCKTSKTAREARFATAPVEKGHAVMEIAARLPSTGLAGGGAMFDESPTPRAVRIRQYLVGAAILVALAIVAVWYRRRSAAPRPTA